MTDKASPRSVADDCSGPYRIAITGWIGCGKSKIGKLLSPVIDTDHLAHELLAAPNPTYNRILAEFGNDLVDSPGGPINRERLGTRVFSDREAKRRLEEIMHPAIFCLMEERIKSHASADIVYVLVPLLFEAGLETRFDEVWAVLVERNTLVARLLADTSRQNMTLDNINRRLAAMWPQEKKAALAHRVIDNSGDFADTTTQVHRCVAKATELARAKEHRCEGSDPCAPRPEPASCNVEYREILRRFAVIGTEQALARIGDVSETEHKTANAHMSMTVDSCTGEHGEDGHNDSRRQIDVDVRMSVRKTPAEPSPHGTCKCKCGNRCRVNCACAPDCGCSCKKPAPPRPHKGLWALFVILAFLIATFALIWLFQPSGGGNTGGGGGVVVVNPPLPTPEPPRPPTVDPAPPSPPPVPPVQCGTVRVLEEPPDFILQYLHNQVRYRVTEWTVTYGAACGEPTTVVGRNAFGKLVNWMEFGDNLKFFHQWMIDYNSAGGTVQVDRFEAYNTFVGRTIYEFSTSRRLVAIRHLDGHQRPVVSARVERDSAGSVSAVTLTWYNQAGKPSSQDVLSAGPSLTGELSKHFFLYRMVADGRLGAW